MPLTNIPINRPSFVSLYYKQLQESQTEQDIPMKQQNNLSEEQKHQIWFRCMKMSNCTPQQAVEFMSVASPYAHMSLTPENQNLLMVASSIGAYFVAKQCILIGVDLNQVDNVGRTALHYAAAIGDIRIFQQIVNNGGDPLKLTIGGQLPLSKACIFCQGQIIEWYLNNALNAFQIGDYCNRKPLQMLKLSGKQLYEQVTQVYKDLTNENQDTEMKD